MRNLLFAGVAGLALAFTAVSAEAQSFQTRPQSSPYAIANTLGFAPFVTEGRSAFVGDEVTEALSNGFFGNGNGAIKNAAPVTQQLDAYPAR